MEADRQDLQEMLVEVFEIDDTPELLPHLTTLFADLPTLGAPLEDTITLLRRGGLTPGSRVVDLGCGRGEIALAVAREFDARTLGVDGSPEFLDIARKAAEQANLANTAKFVQGDIRDFSTTEPFEAALLLSIGPIMGDYQRTMAWLRGLVRPGGLVVIEDCYLAETAPADLRSCYAHLAITEGNMTTHGDRLLARLDNTEAMRWFNDKGMEAVERGAARLLQTHPGLAPVIDKYLDRQRRETEILTGGDIVPSIWLLQRA